MKLRGDGRVYSWVSMYLFSAKIYELLKNMGIPYYLKKKKKKSIFSLLYKHFVELFLIVSIIIVGSKVFFENEIQSTSQNTISFVSNTINDAKKVLGMETNRLGTIKNKDGYVSFLVMGIDSRKLEFDGSEFHGDDRNTDTIIQIVYDSNRNNIFLISIPRDMGYEVEENCVHQGYDKAINRIYKMAEDGNCPEGGVAVLSKYIEKMTGFEVNYHALISFNTFNDIFESIGEYHDGDYGLWMNIPENVYELYPVGDEFEPFNLNKGHQFLNSEDLLRYARSRKSTSDFVRSRRQQEVIKALIKRLEDLELWKKPQTVYDLYETFRDNALYSRIQIGDIISAVNLIDNIKKAKIYHFVLDDQFGGQNQYLMRPAYSPPYGIHKRSGYYLTPVHYHDECCNIDNFLRVKEYIMNIVKFPEIYDEKAIVKIYSETGEFDKLSDTLDNWLDSNPPLFELSQSKEIIEQELEDEIVIVDFSDGEMVETLDYLEDRLDAEVVSPEEFDWKLENDEDISIIIRNNNG